MLNAVQYELSHDSMCITERNSMIHQIICCVCRIGKSMLRTLFHACIVKLHRLKHSCKECQASFCCINCIEYEFFVFLHVFIISKRNSLHRCQKRCQCSVHSSCLTTDKLCNIRVLLLWHDTASCTVSVINIHKLIFVGIPDNHFL